jgi:hypothetical protein
MTALRYLFITKIRQLLYCQYTAAPGYIRPLSSPGQRNQRAAHRKAKGKALDYYRGE